MSKGISLCMIVRDQMPEVTRCLTSIRPFVDELCVAIDSRSTDLEAMKACIDSFQGRHMVYAWENDSFADARNASFAMATNDAIIWLDADDVVSKGAELRHAIIQKIHAEGYTLMVMPYNYTQDEAGDCVVSVFRERVIRRGLYRWVGEVHEILRHINCDEDLGQDVWSKLCQYTWGAPPWEIRHDDQEETVPARFERVYNRLNKKFKAVGPEGLTMRDRYYRAVSARGVRKADEAEQLGMAYCMRYEPKRPGDPYCVSMRLILGDMCAMQSRIQDAMEHYNMAVRLLPTDGIGYQRMSDMLRFQGRWPEAAMYAEAVLDKERGMMSMAQNPQAYDLYPLKLLASYALVDGDYNRALAWLDRAERAAPKELELPLIRHKAIKLKKKDELLEAYRTVEKALKREGAGREKYIPVPRTILAHADFAEMTWNPPRADDRSVVFLCSPNTAEIDLGCRIKGTGGAEESLIIQSQALALRGYDVSVYAPLVEDPEEVNGVMYLPTTHFDYRKPSSIFVGWRNPEAMSYGMNAKYRIFSCHDFVDPEHVRAAEPNFDAALFQCDDHLAEYAEVCRGKARLMPLGIFEDEYCHTSQWRDPFRCVYTSRPERGLVELLVAWPEIKRARPQATLHVLTHLDKLYSQWIVTRPEMRKINDDILRLSMSIKKSGVGGVWINNVIGQGELSSFLAGSGVWLYPTMFRENFCYSAVKAQASGCLPVTNALGSLAEVVHPHFRRVSADINDWRDQAIKYIGWSDQSKRNEVAEWALDWSVEESIDAFEAVIEEIRKRKTAPVAVELPAAVA